MCKRIADRLYQAAMRMPQAHRDWLAEQLGDEKSCKRIMDAFRTVCPESGGNVAANSKGKPSTFILQYQEYIRVEQQVLVDDVGEMKNVSDYVSRAATKEGGHMSCAQATAQFETMVKSGPEHLVDQMATRGGSRV